MKVIEHAVRAHMEHVETWRERALDALVQALTGHIEQVQAAQTRKDPVARDTGERLRADIARLRAMELD